MVLDNSMKITGIEGGTGTIESEEVFLDNYRVATFLFNNPEGNTATVKVKANTLDGEAEYVPFKIRTGESTELEDVGADGKEVTDTGAFLAIVTADSLAHNEYDRVTAEITTDGEIATVFVVQSQPRYSE